MSTKRDPNMNNCHTCSYPIIDDTDFHWCPNCGTLTTPDGSTHVPELTIKAVTEAWSAFRPVVDYNP
jgi:RNA polymerase subunit RPABC4/transcription elongation factor Spt4